MISENIALVRAGIRAAAEACGRDAGEIRLVAAAKTNPAEAVRQAIAAGVDAVGENRVQEMAEKHAQGAYAGAPLHFIGHLQRNKVRAVVGVADLVESADSLELLALIDKRAGEMRIAQDVLLEINIAAERSKHGFFPGELPAVLDKLSAMEHVKVRGLMAIPPISREKGGNRAWFSHMYKLFVDIAAKKYDNVSMDFLSMGMSGDYTDAIVEGANMVRVGSAIFGVRAY